MNRPPLAYKAPYLYETWYESIDYAYAYQWFRSHTPMVAGACSTVRKGNLIGRNLDWTYDESAEFIVHTDSVVGVANAIPTLTDAFVQSGADSELYKVVPFMLSDGMNKHGLFVSTLVVPTDKGDNSVVHPTELELEELCTLMLPRFVLDRFDNADSACEFLTRFVRLYHPKTLQDKHYDQHFVIADKHDTFCMEFVDGQYVVLDLADKSFVTNFHLHGVTFNADWSVNTPASGKASDNGITPNGSGLERYNMINSYGGDINSLMRELAYTRAYQSHPTPAVPRWDTEFVGNGRTVDTPSSGYDDAQIAAAIEYVLRSRDDGHTWHTVHSAVYDIHERKLNIIAQEQYDTQWEVSLMARNTPAPIQQFKGTAEKLSAYTGPVGELTVDTTDKTVRVQDGATVGGHPVINTTTDQTVAGAKTFAVSPKVPTPAQKDNSQKWASTEYVSEAIKNIDPETLGVATKDAHGVVQVGNGLYVNDAGVVGVGSIERPSVTSPSGVVIPSSGVTVIASVFSSEPSDTHVKTDYKITADIAGENIIAQFSGNGANLTQHFFSSSDLNSMVTGQTYYIFVRFWGQALGASDWSAPSVVQAISGQVTPMGRTIYRHPSNKGSVIIYDEFGVTKNLLVYDAAYRTRANKAWGQYNIDVPGINNWAHYWACSLDVQDTISGFTNYSTYATLPTARFTDAKFRQVLGPTLRSVLQSAKAATDILMNYSDTDAAHFCRQQNRVISGIEAQLPNIYQLLVMYAEGDAIDALDPTLAANSTMALGKYTNTYRWFSGNTAWSSTEYSSTHACYMDDNGTTGGHAKTATYSVAPVAEL